MPHDTRNPGAVRSRLYRIVIFTLLLGAAVSSGCSWGFRDRPARPGEALVLESVVAHAPADEDWEVGRVFDAGARAFHLTHRKGGEWDRSLTILEVDGTDLSGPDSLSRYRGYELTSRAAEARSLLADPGATVSEMELPLASRFGKAAVQVAIRGEESDAKAGLLVKHFMESASLAFVSPTGPGRTCLVRYDQRSLEQDEPPALDATWRAIIDGVELRSADEAHVREAAKVRDFPKQLDRGLARRSISLPKYGFQTTYAFERSVDPNAGESSNGLALSFGLTDHVEIDTPGFVRYSFGEPEALTSAEWAAGAGFAGVAHDALRGTVWGLGARLYGRKRLSPDVAWRVIVFSETTHESRTGRNQAGGGAVAGLVWDAHRWVTLGLETGWSRSPWSEESRNLAWVGGRSTSLVTVHVGPLDVGFDGAAAWDEGRLSALAGFTVRLIL